MNPVVLVPGFYGNVLMTPKSAEQRVGRNAAFSLDPTPGGMKRWRSANEVFVDRNRSKLVPSQNLSTLDTVDGVRDLVPELRKFDMTGRLDAVIGYGYFGRLIDEAESSGLVAESTLRSVSYDYRMILQELELFHEKLALTIEKAFASGEGKRCNLVAHSLGGLLVHHFLTEMSRTWKQKYVEQLVTVNSPFGGASATFECMVTGDLQFNLMPREYGETFRNFSGFALTLPNFRCFTDPNEIILWENLGCQNYRGYRVEDIEKVADLVNADTYWISDVLGRRVTRSFTRSHGVPTTFVVDTKTRTATRMYTYQLQPGLQTSCYRRDYHMGDGRVSAASLLSISTFSANYGVRCLPGEGHTLILQSDAFMGVLRDLSIL